MPTPSLYRAAPRISGTSPRKASSFPLSSSPAQRDFPQKEPPPSLYRAAPRSGSSPRKSLLPTSSSIEQPRAAGAPLVRAPPFLSRAAPRRGSSPRTSLHLPSIEQPRAAGAPLEIASSLPLTGSRAQRELPQKEPPPSLYRAAPRSGTSPRNSLLPPSIAPPRAEGAP